MKDIEPVRRSKRNARQEVHTAIKYGTLIRPDKCQKCGISCKPDAHHHLGYEIGKRLDVVWLCRKCHLDEHHKNIIINHKTHYKIKTSHNEFRPIPEKENITKPRGMQHCPECNRWFSTFGHFLRHLYTQHKQIVVK